MTPFKNKGISISLGLTLLLIAAFFILWQGIEQYSYFIVKFAPSGANTAMVWWQFLLLGGMVVGSVILAEKQSIKKLLPYILTIQFPYSFRKCTVSI